MKGIAGKPKLYFSEAISGYQKAMDELEPAITEAIRNETAALNTIAEAAAK